jgi:hypothetical protein
MIAVVLYSNQGINIQPAAQCMPGVRHKRLHGLAQRGGGCVGAGVAHGAKDVFNGFESNSSNL